MDISVVSNIMINGVISMTSGRRDVEKKDCLCTLFLRMQINTDIMEKYMGAPQQMKTRITT
jgi:hypothetical protein